MKKKFKFILITTFLFLHSNLYSYEIVRDPIFEDYFFNLNKDLNLSNINVYLVRNKISNAFVIEDNIYFTTGLLEELNDEDTLKAIFLHEYGHVYKNHFQAKKINIQKLSKTSTFYNLFSIGLAVLSNNTNLGIGASITLNSNIVNNISKHSVNFEIEADDFMLKQIKKNKISTGELIFFLNNKDNPNNKYFRTHPSSENRINNLREFQYIKSENSKKFEWIKSKYTNNSNIKSFNIFFKNLDKGIYNQGEKFDEISRPIILYEAFRKGFIVENWEDEFQNLLDINDNSFLKIEYINYILDNNLDYKFQLIEDLKFDKNIMSEYFYYYIYGKYYNKINKTNLSNFFFCQFYKTINSENKSDFFCKKYDIKDIPTLDKSYAIFK